MALLLSRKFRRHNIATTVCLLFQHQVKWAMSFMVMGHHPNTITAPDDVIRMYSSSNNHDNPNPMDMVHREWSVEDDEFLYQNYKSKGVEYVANQLGRGVGGVDKRWSKLTKVSSKAYQRLFASTEDDDEEDADDTYLIPVQEVLQRIQWDPSLTTSDFTVWYKDRYHAASSDIPLLLSTSFDAPNLSVKGKEPLFVKAIPSHRIMAIQYKSDYILWDKEARTCSPNFHNNQFVQLYPQWKQQRTKDYQQLLQTIQSILHPGNGNDADDHAYFQTLKQTSSSLIEQYKDEYLTLTQQILDRHIQSILQIFQSALNDYTIDTSVSQEEEGEQEDYDMESDEMDITMTPTSDVESLQLYKQLVSFLPYYDLRQQLTRTIEELIRQKKELEQSKNNNNNTKQRRNPELPILVEEELEESFVRGSGSGGQKINKTSNRVILVHIPTQLRVECQDTRSLQQNRKIARKRLREKLDDYLHGTTSRKSIAQQKIQKKKQRARAKAKKKHNKTTTKSENNA